MQSRARSLIGKCFALVLALTLPLLMTHDSAHAQARPVFSQQQLEETLAPIALYPDPLLSQILMASTHPLDIVEAARWSRSHANLIGDDVLRAAENENWDPSVKSLLAFPQVLAQMDENLQWLETLGGAFLGQEAQVMDTIQNLRRRAQAAGNLRSDERQRIVDSGALLIVQPADTRIIYVPYYDPRLVYGPARWPHYAPVHWRAFPGYRVWPGQANSFYWGPSIRISLGHFFSEFDWSRRHVSVVRPHYYGGGAANRRASVPDRERSPAAWQHDHAHRPGAAYRGAEVQQLQQMQQRAPTYPSMSIQHSAPRHDAGRIAVPPPHGRPSVQAPISSPPTHQAAPRGSERQPRNEAEARFYRTWQRGSREDNPSHRSRERR